MTTEHTQLPWKVGEPMNPPAMIIEPVDRNGGPAFIAQTVGGNDEANAEYVVKACNAYPKLVKVLHELLESLGHDNLAQAAVRAENKAWAVLAEIEKGTTP